MDVQSKVHRMKGFNQTSNIMLTVIIGIVMLFIGVFTLASIEPIFDGRLTECSYSSVVGSPEIEINGTANESALQNYTLTVAGETCVLSTTLENQTEASGSVYAYTYPGGVLLATITDPTDGTTTTEDITATTGTYAINYTFIGDGDTNVTTDSFMYCCSSLVAQQSPAGQIYDPTVTTTGIAFGVFGLVLIIVGLAYGIGALKNMM